jgi:AraC-like DNA-binding protein
MSRELLTVDEQGDCFRVVLHRASPSLVAHRAYMESGVFALCRLLRQCAGVAGLPRVVQFDYPAPRHAQRYRALFRCPVVFDAEATAIEVSAALAAHPNMNAAPEVDARLRSYADGLLEAHRGDLLSRRVLAFLREQPELQRTSMEQVGERLGISERTLRRRLQAEGTSYPLLVQRALQERAEALLRDPERSVKEVAYELGFADPSAFHRAVRRWTGKAPGELRAGSSRPPPSKTET